MRLYLQLIFSILLLGVSHVGYTQDTPCTAVTLSSNMADFVTYSTVGLSNSGINQPDCGNNISVDIWFEVTVPANGYVNIVTLAGTMTDAAMAIYSGNCNNPTETNCSDDDNCGNSIMPILALYNQPTGSTILIRIWSETAATGDFDIQITNVVPTAAPLNLVTVASATATSTSCVQLTPASNTQLGCAWEPVPFDFTMPFQYNISLNFGSLDANGADGICLVFQNDPSGLATCGNSGGDIGANGIQNSFIIEFDTWNNGAGVNDIAQDHIAISINGDLDNPINGPNALGNIEDGQEHEVLFTWNPATNFYEITFDGAVVISGNYDIVNNCFGGVTSVFGGFTASTGGSNNLQTVCSVAPDSYPSGNEALVEVEICEGDGYFVGGGFQTTAGVYQDVYGAFNGCDSIIKTNLVIIPSSSSVVNETICAGDCFFYNGQPYCGPGQYMVTLTNVLNCDSIVEFNLTVIDPVIDIVQPDVLNCNVSTTLLDATNSVSGVNVSYLWSTNDGSCLNGDTNLPVITANCSGTYTFSVFQTVGNMVCMASEEVEVVEVQVYPFISIATPDELSCATPCTIIDASASDGSAVFSHTWTGPNGFMSNEQNPQVCNPGTYQLIILNTSLGCADTATVEVLLDGNNPFADAGNDGLLNCVNDVVTLDGSNSSQNSDFVMEWTAVDGTVLGDLNSIEVSEDGIYILSVSSISNGCNSQDTVVVTSSYGTPIAISSPDAILDCVNTTILLDGAASNSFENFSFSWQNTLGVELSNDTIYMTETAGIYTLVINNLNNGCADTTMTEITQNILPPTADAGMNQTIDCNNATVDLSGIASSGAGGISFLWMDSAGVSIGATNLTTVNMHGEYELIVTDLVNGCRDTSSVTVFNNIVFPAVNAGADTLIDCFNPSITLRSDGADAGTNFAYEWQNVAGENIGILSTVDIGSAGDYVLIIHNIANGCSASDVVFVGEDFTSPSTDAGLDTVLNCVDSSIILNGISLDIGDNFSYEWQDGSGNLIGQDLAQEINAADTYTFIITDNNNGCRDSSSLVVSLEVDAPIADAGIDFTLNCEMTAVSLDGSASSDGSNITYEWVDENGTVLGNETILPVMNTGTYSLEVLDTTNGCRSISNAVVNIDTIAPPLPNLPDVILNCNHRERRLGQLLMTIHPNWIFNWQHSSGENLAVTDTILVGVGGVYTLDVLNSTNFCTSTREVTVMEDFTLPVVDLLTPDTLDCITTSLSIVAGNSDNGNNFALTWQNSADEVLAENTTSLLVDEADMYTLSITNLLNGCLSKDSVQVGIDTLYPLAIINPIEDITCTNPIITLDGNGSSVGNNFSLTWQNELGENLGTALQLPVNTPGNYLLSVENTENDCRSEFSILVNENTIPPIANAGADVILNCYAPTNTLTGQNDGVSNTVIYEWTNENGEIIGVETSLNIENLANYTLTLPDTINGCVHQDLVEVFENFTLPTADAGADVLLDCTTTMTTLGAGNTSVGTNFEYEWQNLSGNPIGNDIDFTTMNAGDYIFVVLDAENGCLDTAEVSVMLDQVLPNVALEVNEVLTCVQLTAVLNGEASDTGTNFTYNWTTINGGTILSGATELTPFVETPGFYELLLTNTENGCESSQQIEVTQNIIPPVANAGIDFELDCHSPVSSLDASNSTPFGNLDFLWSTVNGQFETNINTMSPSVSLPGDYELLVTDVNNGCTAVGQVTVSSNFITNWEVEDIQPLCYDDTGSLIISTVSGGLPPFVYSIDGGETYSQSTQFSNLSSGQYTVVIQDANACEVETTATLNAPNEVLISLEAQVTILLGEEFQLNAQTNIPEEQIATITWTPAAILSCDTCLHTIAAPYVTTTFIVTIIDTNNCSAQALTEVFVDKTPPVYIPNVFSPNGDGTNDIFMIFGDTRGIKAIKSFQVFDRWGEPVFESYNFLPNNPATGWDGNNYNGKPYNPAVFVYLTEIEFIDGRIELFKGDVTLVR